MTLAVIQDEIFRAHDIRASFDYGWGLIRASNTTPNLVLRFKAVDENALQKIKALFRQEITRILPHLSLLF